MLDFSILLTSPEFSCLSTSSHFALAMAILKHPFALCYPPLANRRSHKGCQCKPSTYELHCLCTPKKEVQICSHGHQVVKKTRPHQNDKINLVCSCILIFLLTVLLWSSHFKNRHRSMAPYDAIEDTLWTLRVSLSRTSISINVKLISFPGSKRIQTLDVYWL
jgi:hypothetical protein